MLIVFSVPVLRDIPLLSTAAKAWSSLWKAILAPFAANLDPKRLKSGPMKKSRLNLKIHDSHWGNILRTITYVPCEYALETFITIFKGLLMLGFNNNWLEKQVPWLVNIGFGLNITWQQGIGVKSASHHRRKSSHLESMIFFIFPLFITIIAFFRRINPWKFSEKNSQFPKLFNICWNHVFLYSIELASFNKRWIILWIVNFFSPNFQGLNNALCSILKLFF